MSSRLCEGQVAHSCIDVSPMSASRWSDSRGPLDEWEVWSMTGQDDLNSGAKWQATKMEEVKIKGSGAGEKEVLSVDR